MTDLFITISIFIIIIAILVPFVKPLFNYFEKQRKLEENKKEELAKKPPQEQLLELQIKNELKKKNNENKHGCIFKFLMIIILLGFLPLALLYLLLT